MSGGTNAGGLSPGAVVAELSELLTVPSVGGTTAEAEIQHRLAERLDGLGLSVDLWALDLPAVRSAPGYPGEEVPRSQAWGLVAVSRPGEEVGVILEGHVDVVPPGDLGAWHSDPFAPRVAGGTVTGRGACDMKGGLAAILAAVAALGPRRSEVPAFAVHCTIGEEDGGLGAFASLQRGHTGAACVIPEPTSLRLVTANAGSLTFRIEVPGLATHGSTAYAGVSAIDGYLPLHRALAELAERRNRDPEPLMAGYAVAYPLSVGRLEAGDWASSVPDRLVAEGRYGLRIEEDPARARAELEEAVATAADRDPFLRDHPPSVTWPGGAFRGGHLPVGHPLRDVVATGHLRATGVAAEPERGAPWGSDLRLYAGAGVPTLHYGPGDVRLAHGPDESVPVAEVLTCAEVLGHVLEHPPLAG
ncbi:MAG: putative deacetylase/succinyl-diaminopimelate desuccinylase [Friedmanniella sp.]|nr:putative deacetylase/succinyl-diaminopimelate desuccinylase [Friedmanniella sp.]